MDAITLRYRLQSAVEMGNEIRHKLKAAAAVCLAVIVRPLNGVRILALVSLVWLLASFAGGFHWLARKVPLRGTDVQKLDRFLAMRLHTVRAVVNEGPEHEYW
jgi:hypothetical protein